MSQKILSVEDFNSILDNYAGRTISHIPVTQSTSNISGKETLSDGTPANIKCYVMKTGQNFDYGKYGLTEKGDAICLAKVADNVRVNSKLVFNGETFRVRESFDVPGVFDSTGAATYVYTVCSLFLIE